MGGPPMTKRTPPFGIGTASMAPTFFGLLATCFASAGGVKGAAPQRGTRNFPVQISTCFDMFRHVSTCFDICIQYLSESRDHARYWSSTCFSFDRPYCFLLSELQAWQNWKAKAGQEHHSTLAESETLLSCCKLHIGPHSSESIWINMNQYESICISRLSIWRCLRESWVIVIDDDLSWLISSTAWYIW